MLARAVHQPLDLTLGEIARLTVKFTMLGVRFLDVDFMRINLACAPTVRITRFSRTVRNAAWKHRDRCRTEAAEP
jgi:hypothetical protein